ncbi:MAG: hypothetical protein U0527_14540 [Candidatus Eisenbacteria bacterium]
MPAAGQVHDRQRTRCCGHHRRAWDRRDNAGNRVAGGIYFLRMTAALDQKTQKLVLPP